MSTTEITSKIENLRELEDLIEEAKAEAEALRDEIKQELDLQTRSFLRNQYWCRNPGPSVTATLGKDGYRWCFCCQGAI